MTIQEVWLRNIYILDVDFNSYLFSTLPKTNMDPQIDSLEPEFLCNYGDYTPLIGETDAIFGTHLFYRYV